MPGAPRTAAILAGGLGTRLRSVVADRPKVLAEVAGRPFIVWLLDKLASAGLERVVLCTGFASDQVRATLGDRHGPLELVYSEEPTPLGTGGALRLALPLLGAGPVLVLNGDSWCGADLRVLFDVHTRKAARASVLLVEVEDARRFGAVLVNDRDEVTAFREKDPSVGRAWINAGIYLFERDVVASLAPDLAASLERDLLPSYIGRGLFAARVRAPFVDIGTPASYVLAAEVIQSSRP